MQGAVWQRRESSKPCRLLLEHQPTMAAAIGWHQLTPAVIMLGLLLQVLHGFCHRHFDLQLPWPSKRYLAIPRGLRTVKRRVPRRIVTWKQRPQEQGNLAAVPQPR
jgi:hypothetical protein